ncbi:hypothetical protein [Deinococcus multiflagellatus]|uniref:Minor tail protein n=2 Tax=Deinococcus multiflagellatus TaxID=1656887 RepID=A0ABW1ZS27_9DEIO
MYRLFTVAGSSVGSSLAGGNHVSEYKALQPLTFDALESESNFEVGHTVEVLDANNALLATGTWALAPNAQQPNRRVAQLNQTVQLPTNAIFKARITQGLVWVDVNRTVGFERAGIRFLSNPNMYLPAFNFFSGTYLPKGVAGPLDPEDLPGAATLGPGRVYTGTDDGPGFVDLREVGPRLLRSVGGNGQSMVTLAQDDFTRVAADLGPDWQVTGGAWATDGEAAQGTGGVDFARWRRPVGTTGGVEMHVQGSAGILHARYVDNNNRVSLSLEDGGTKLVLFVMVGGAGTVLQQWAVATPPEGATIRLEYTPTELRAYLDGQWKGTVANSDHADTATVGVYSGGGTRLSAWKVLTPGGQILGLPFNSVVYSGGREVPAGAVPAGEVSVYDQGGREIDRIVLGGGDQYTYFD